MKFHTEESRTVIRSGTSEERTFNIKGSAKAFKVLSDKMYSDKPRAIIRELAANAKDAMISAGKSDQPFEIHLPNTFEPWFSVKDNGIGLSHEDVMNLYSTYFESTKTDSNDETGCLGLGSKSPFAYVDAFTVESRWNGVLTLYSCYYNEEGIPAITVMGESMETDDVNGFEVKMAVKEYDMNEFASKAAKELRRFDPAPIVMGNKDYGIEEIDYWLEGTDWKIIRGDNYHGYGSNVHVIQGNITYPIKQEVLKDLTSGQRAVLETKVDIWFPSGELDVAPSREELSYDDTTIANIKARLDIVAAEVVPMFHDQFDDAKTLWEARKIFNTMSRELPNGLRTLLTDSNVGLKWKGKALSSHFTFNEKDVDFSIIGFEKGYYGNRGRKMEYSWHGDKKIEPNDTIAFYYDDVGHGAHSRLTYYLDENNGVRHNYLIKTEAKKDLRKFSKMLGNVKIQAISNLPKRPRAEQSEKRVTSKVLEYTGSSRDRRDSWSPTEVLLKDGGIYVMINRFKVHDKYNGSEHWSEVDFSFDSIINIAKEHNIIDLTDKTIYGIRKGDVEKLKDDSGWVSLFDLIRDNLAKAIAKEKVAQKIANYNAFEQFDFDFSPFDDNLIKEKFTKGTALFKFLKAYKYMRDQDHSRATAIRSVAIKVRYDLTEATAKHDLSAMWKEVLDTYPLLDFISIDDLRGGYYSTENSEANFAKLIDYINMVDAQTEDSLGGIAA